MVLRGAGFDLMENRQSCAMPLSFNGTHCVEGPEGVKLSYWNLPVGTSELWADGKLKAEPMVSRVHYHVPTIEFKNTIFDHVKSNAPINIRPGDLNTGFIWAPTVTPDPLTHKITVPDLSVDRPWPLAAP